MASRTRTELKTLFETGDTPTQGDFVDLLDSIPHFADGEVSAAFIFDFEETDWITSGGYLQLTILAATHNRGLKPSVELEELTTAYNSVDPNSIEVNAAGDITIQIISPAGFAGRALIQAG